MDRVSALLYLEINIAALIIMVVVMVKSIGFSRMESHKAFILALSVQLAFAFSGTVFEAVNQNLLPYNGAILVLFKTIHIFVSVGLAYGWLLYFEEMQGNSILHNKRLLVYTSIPLWLTLYILIGNLFNHSLFYIDSQGVFQIASWYYVMQYLLPCVYVFFIIDRAIHGAFKNRQKPEGKIFLAYAILPLPATIAAFLQLRYPEFALLNITLALTTLIMYVNSTDAVVSVDPLTQLFNRRQFMRTFSLWYGTRNEAVPMYFMIVDVDKFKMVNDIYGHNEGDNALIRVAETLKAACTKQRKKSVVARYGGDEFTLLVEAAGEDEIKKLVTQINRTLREMDIEAGAPYKLSLSIGYARLDEAKTIKAVIDLADERQYEEKKIHHRIIEAGMAEEKMKADQNDKPVN